MSEGSNTVDRTSTGGFNRGGDGVGLRGAYFEVGDQGSVGRGSEGVGGVGAHLDIAFSPVDEDIAFGRSGSEGDGFAFLIFLSEGSDSVDRTSTGGFHRGGDGVGLHRQRDQLDVLIVARIHLFGVVVDTDETSHGAFLTGGDGEGQVVEAVVHRIVGFALGEGGGATSRGVTEFVVFVEGH